MSTLNLNLPRKKTDQRPELNQPERRSFVTEFRADGDGRTVTGYAAVFNEVADLGWFTESIAPGAFDGVIQDSDARALFNHDPNHLLARQGSGTLKLSVDERGLRYEFTMPDTTLGNDLLKLIERGDLRESSFAFTVAEQEWEDEFDNEGNLVKSHRTIKRIGELFDVSPVTYPAYEATTVAKRHYDAWRAKQQPEHGRFDPDVLRLVFA